MMMWYGEEATNGDLKKFSINNNDNKSQEQQSLLPTNEATSTSNHSPSNTIVSGAQRQYNSIVSPATSPHAVSRPSSRAEPRSDADVRQLTVSPLHDDANSNDTAAVAGVDEAMKPKVLTMKNIIQTYSILITVLLIACNVDSVATLWSLIGSSISLMITFIFPAAFYLKIRQHTHVNTMMICAWALLIGSTILMVICTYCAIVNVLK